jgi:HD-like signal output (HDOD) protein
MLGPRGGVTMERFWDASAKGAALTARISHNLYNAGRDEAYTYGLFENVGIPILMARFPAYKETLRRANQDSTQAFTAVEEQAHGVNHAVIGSMLARSWFLPDFLTQAIRHHHDYGVLANPPAALSVQSRNLIAMGLLADHAVREHSKVGASAEWAKGGAQVAEYVGLNPAQLEELLEDLKVALDEM